MTTKTEQPASTGLNIRQRIHAVMQEVDYIKRGSAGQGTGVRYDEVIAKLRPSMIKHGINLEVSEAGEVQKVDEIVAKSGSKQSLYQGRCDVRLVNIDNPGDYVSYIISAHGMDNGDKAPGKLNTYATKVALVKAFALETGDDDESRNGQQEQPVNYASQQQIAQFNQILQQLGASEHQLMAYCCQKIWNCAPVSFAELTEEQATQVIQLSSMRLQHQQQARQQAQQGAGQQQIQQRHQPQPQDDDVPL